MSKTTKILEYMKSGKTITQMQAVDKFGAYRLSSIIYNLKKRGYTISTIDREEIDRYGKKSRFAEYKLMA